MYRLSASPHNALRVASLCILPGEMTQSPAERLKLAMRARGIGDAPELAALVGINLSTVRSNLNGHRGISKDNAPKYASRLRTSVEWLIYGQGEPPGASDPAAAPMAGALGIVDDMAPTLRAERSQPIVTPDGATGLAFLSSEGKAIVVELDRNAIDQVRRNLLSLEAFLARRP